MQVASLGSNSRQHPELAGQRCRKEAGEVGIPSGLPLQVAGVESCWGALGLECMPQGFLVMEQEASG